MGKSIRWVHGFLAGDKAITLIPEAFAEDLLRYHKELPFPLNLHINSLFQFYIVPLINLIALNNPENFKGSTPTIWFNGFREMQSILPYDFKFWSFTGKKGFAPFIRMLVLIYFFSRFTNYIVEIVKRNLLVKNNPETLNDHLEQLVLIRKPIHLSVYRNPFYKSIVSDNKKMLFFLPGRKINKDEVLAPLNFIILGTALKRCLSAIFSSFANDQKITIQGMQFNLKSAFFESCCHFDTWLYNEQLQAITSRLNRNCKILSFEQVSWSAELEKLHFKNHDLSHIQFGVFPYYPYPCIGVDSKFYLRSNNVLNDYREAFPDRNFKKLTVASDFFKKVDYQTEKPASFVFASQPYRKAAEKELLSQLSGTTIGAKIKLKYHPREKELYPKFDSVEDLFSLQNLVVITRTSSFVIELFARGIPYMCYIDDEDQRLDLGEVAKLEDPVVFTDTSKLFHAINDIEGYVKVYTDWRNETISQYV